MVETASQTDRMVCCCQVREEIEEIEVGEESEREDSDDGSLYEPSGSDSGSDEKRLSEEEEEEEEEEGDGGGSEAKYLVFWTCLLNLFAMIQCGQCGVVANTVRRTVCGTLVRVYHTCLMCGAERVWCSQPSVRSGAPAGNIHCRQPSFPLVHCQPRCYGCCASWAWPSSTGGRTSATRGSC